MTDDLDDLREALGDYAKPKKKAERSARDERVIAGFEDIQKFVDEHGHPPKHGEDRDIFERLYAVRLDRIRAQADCVALLSGLDRQGLLEGAATAADAAENEADLDELAAELRGAAPPADAVTNLKHVRSHSERQAAEEIANRKQCKEFDAFQPLFERVQREIKDGVRETRRFERDASIKQGDFFIVRGQIAYVAEYGEEFKADYGERDSRLRVVFDNGTESNLLMRSLSKALYADEAGRRVTEPDAGPLFGAAPEDDDLESGTIYVLQSKSDHPDIAENRELIHKIGVTGGSVEARIANARLEPTYLMADVEIVRRYPLFNINRTKLENLLHRIFAPARLDIEIADRFGHPVRPREWFLAPLQVIEQVIDRISDGTITRYRYDPGSASLVEIEAAR